MIITQIKYRGYLIVISEIENSKFRCQIYSFKPDEYLKMFYCDDFEECIKQAKKCINEKKMCFLKKLIMKFKR